MRQVIYSYKNTCIILSIFFPSRELIHSRIQDQESNYFLLSDVSSRVGKQRSSSGMYYLLLFLTQVQPSIKKVGFSPDFQCKRNQNLGRVEIRVHTIFMVGVSQSQVFPSMCFGYSTTPKFWSWDFVLCIRIVSLQKIV